MKNPVCRDKVPLFETGIVIVPYMSDLSVWQPGKETEVPAFPLAFLGYQRKAVDQYLETLLEPAGAGPEVIELQADPAASTVQLDRYRDLGREIGDLLSAVQETAAQIREGAEIDAARWRGEATEEIENRIASAQATAEELRESAWQVSTQMIAQLQDMEQEAYRSIEKHSQEVIAEAENEAHRIREEARRRADGIRSNAHVESIELEERSRELCDQLIESAEQKVAAIQERVLALERHRDQLLEEIGGIRSGVAPIGVKLVDQTGGLVFPDPTDEEEPAHVTPHHEMSGLVKVITPSKQSEDSAAQSTAPAAEEPQSQEADQAGGDGSSGHRDQAADSHFEDLFASLRRTKVSYVRPAAQTREEPRPVRAESESEVTEEPSLELREEMLLPVSNQFLRLFKRLLTEEQNRVLEGLRTGQLTWGVEEVDTRMRSHLEMLVEQSWHAGHRAAEQLSGSRLAKPDAVMGKETGFTEQLVAEVTEAIAMDGSSDSAQRSRLASRTFRVWRSEKLGRFLRETSEDYYERGLSASLNRAGTAL